MTDDGLNVVITGGSKGVGLELIKLLLSEKNNVINLSRTPPPITDNRLTHVECDLNVKQSVESACTKIKTKINCIIFNAANAKYGNVLSLSEESVNEIISTNFTGPVVMLKKLINNIVINGKLIFVSSSASRIPAPKFGFYAATKLAFESLIQTVAMEHGLKVQIARPCEIDTDFAKSSGVPQPSISNIKKLSPITVAKEIIKLMKSNRTYKNIGFRSKILDLVVRFCPQILLTRKIKS